MFTIQTRHVPAQRVMSAQRRLHVEQIPSFVAETYAAFAELLAGASATGPLTLIFHGIVDADRDGPLEIVLGCPDGIAPTDAVGIRIEPAHDEAYTTITKAQWAYPAILAAYDAVAGSAVVASRPGQGLPCREVYLVDPNGVGEQDLVCDVAFPLAER
jgi:hypothetical protein